MKTTRLSVDKLNKLVKDLYNDARAGEVGCPNNPSQDYWDGQADAYWVVLFAIEQLVRKVGGFDNRSRGVL